MKKKILSLVCVLALILCQFTCISSLSASATALNSRNDFVWGINIHSATYNYTPYAESTYNVMKKAAKLGAKAVRINYNPSIATLGDTDDFMDQIVATADAFGLDIMLVSTLSGTATEVGTFYQNVATAYAGKIKYYMLGNELDANFTGSHHTFSSSNNTSELNTLKGKFESGISAIKAADANAQTAINFSCCRYGFITWLMNNSTTIKNNLDIAAIDWYDDYDDCSAGGSFTNSVNGLYTYFTNNSLSTKIYVAEANKRPTENGNYDTNATWLTNLMTSAYNNSKVSGFFPYELYDEPTFESDAGGEFHPESHYGLISKTRDEKSVFADVQALMGGSDVADSTIPAAITGDYVKATTNASTLVVSIANNKDLTFATLGDRLFGSFTATNFSTSDYVEFDLYVGDYEALTAADKALNLRLSSANGYRDYKNFNSLITKSGWNHIKLSGASFQGGDGTTIDWSAITGYKFYFSNASSSNTDYYWIDLGVANLVGTVGAYTIKPAMPSNVGIVLSENGVANTWGTNYNNTQDRIRVAVDSADVSNVDFFEFDIYIENYDNFNANVGSLYFVLTSNSTYNASRCLFPFKEQVTKSGWNHIKVAKDLYNSNLRFGDSNRSLSAIKYAYLSFYDKDGVANTACGSDMVRIANICGTLGEWSINPTAPKFIDKVVSTDGIKATYGNNISLKHDSGAIYTTSANLDLSASEYLEFDVYVGDIDVFNQYAGQVALYLSLTESTSGGCGSRHADYDLEAQVTKTGWNHVKLAISDFCTRGAGGKTMTFTNVQRVGIHSWTDAAKTCALGTDMIRVANICGTKSEINVLPAISNPNAVLATVSTDGITKEYGNNISLKHDAGAAYVASNTTDLSAAEYLEFDVFVGDIDVFNQYAGQVAFYLSLTESTSGGCGSRHADYDLEAQVTKSGWNHVKLAISDFCTRGAGGKTMTFTNVQRAGIHSWTDAAKTCALGTDMIRVANICGTVDMPLSASNTTLINAYKSGKWGANYNYVNDNSLMTFATPVDISDSKYIEFDFYVENYDHFRSAVPNADAWFRLFICTQSGNVNARRALYSFDDQVTKTGWNHIKLLKSSYGQRGGDGGPIFSSVCYARIGFWSNTSANSYCANETFKIANLSGSNNETGDINRDSNVNILDLVALKKAYANVENQNFFCDVNYDYTFDANDATSLINLLIG